MSLSRTIQSKALHPFPFIPCFWNFAICIIICLSHRRAADLLIWCPVQGAAIAFYVLFSLFVNSFVIIFVVTVFLAALDFWVVKNVSGRILVGLRWWNEISEQGDSVWKFEALDQEVCKWIVVCSFSGPILYFILIGCFKILAMIQGFWILVHSRSSYNFSVCLWHPQSLSRINKKDSWLFWWTLYLTVSYQAFAEVYINQ